MKTPACAACKHQRRKCASDCFLAPFFPPEKIEDFEAVHRLFGVHNIVNHLKIVPFTKRPDAVVSMVYEANARVRDPVLGCSGILSVLLQRRNSIIAELDRVRNEVAYYRSLKQQREQNMVEGAGFVDFLQGNNNANLLLSLNQDLNFFHDNLGSPQQLQGSSFPQETQLFGGDSQVNSLAIGAPVQGSYQPQGLLIKHEQSCDQSHDDSMTNLSIGGAGGSRRTSLPNYMGQRQTDLLQGRRRVSSSPSSKVLGKRRLQDIEDA